MTEQEWERLKGFHINKRKAYQMSLFAPVPSRRKIKNVGLGIGEVLKRSRIVSLNNIYL